MPKEIKNKKQVKVVALNVIHYNGEVIPAGCRFTISEQGASILEARQDVERL